MKIKLLDTRLLIMGVLFVLTIMYMTTTSIELIDYNTATFVSKLQGEEVVDQLMDNVKLFENTADSIADDKDIINNLNNIAQYGYKDEYVTEIKNNNIVYYYKL